MSQAAPTPSFEVCTREDVDRGFLRKADRWRCSVCGGRARAENSTSKDRAGCATVCSGCGVVGGLVWIEGVLALALRHPLSVHEDFLDEAGLPRSPQLAQAIAEASPEVLDLMAQVTGAFFGRSGDSATR